MRKDYIGEFYHKEKYFNRLFFLHASVYILTMAAMP